MHMERWLWGAVGLLALAVVGLFSYRYLQSQDELPMVSAELSSCDLQQGPCSAVIQGVGAVTLTIAPRPIPLVEPLELKVETAVAGVREVDVDFSGVDMNMGYNRFRLKAADAGRHEGAGMLPVCVRNRMTWEAKVMLATDSVMYVVPFRFDTVARR
jgi:hypothetical protein